MLVGGAVELVVAPLSSVACFSAGLPLRWNKRRGLWERVSGGLGLLDGDLIIWCGGEKANSRCKRPAALSAAVHVVYFNPKPARASLVLRAGQIPHDTDPQCPSVGVANCLTAGGSFFFFFFLSLWLGLAKK